MKRLLLPILSMIILMFCFAACKGAAEAEKEGTGSGSLEVETTAGTTDLSDEELDSVAREMAMSAFLAVHEAGPVLHISEISFAGDAEEVVREIWNIRVDDRMVYAFAVNSAENLAELSEFGWKSGVRDFNPQELSAEFFETGFILVTTYWMSTQGYGFEFSVGECDGELININKVMTHPSLSDREVVLRPSNGLYVAYSLIPVKYSGQTVYYTETIAP